MNLGMGIFKTEDSGRTWKHMGLAATKTIHRIIIDPRNPNIIYVGAMGDPFTADSNRGLYKTTDGGKTWSQVLKKDQFTGCIDFALNPKNSKVGLAAMYQRDRRAWNFLESGPGSEVMRTEDGGNTWKSVPGLPKGDVCGRVGLAWAPSDEKVVYALIENPGKNEEWADEDERVPSGRLTPRRFSTLTEEQFLNADKETLVCVFIDHHVISDRSSNLVSPHSPWPHLLIWCHIKQPVIICAPGKTPGCCIGDHVWHI
jgi:hypothetical protein